MGSPVPPRGFYRPDIEAMSREDMDRLQLNGIRQLLERLYHTSKFYRRRLEEAGVKPEDVTSFESFRERVPFMSKKDLVRDQEENPPYGNRLPVPESEIRKVHMTSGTSGQGQEVYALTRKDIDLGADTFRFHLHAGGLEAGDVSALCWPVATMPGGLLAMDSLTAHGANGMLIQLFDSKMKLSLMKRFNVHHFWATPAYLTRLSVLAEELGIEPKRDLPRLKFISLSTEPFPVEWALRMQEFWGCTIHDGYGSSQFGSLYAYTCEGGVAPGGRRGYYHLCEHTAYVEVLNPQTNEPVQWGEEGEPVITTFAREAGPLLRFRQGDRIRPLAPGTCGCGRTSIVWEAGTIARLDDMIKMKATNVWPQTVDDIVFAYTEIDEYNGRVFIDDAGRERVALKLEFRRHVTDPEVKQRIIARLPGELKAKTAVTMEIEEVPYGTVDRFEYKARRWTDERMSNLKGTRFIEKA